MKSSALRAIASLVVAATLFVVAAVAAGSVEATAGPYRVSMVSQPSTIPVGQAKLVFTITTDGEPAENLDVTAIAEMPGMIMGEREQKATPVTSEPGAYQMQAAFPMSGTYEVTVQISGSAGDATAVIPVSTGQDTTRNGGGLTLTSILILLGLISFAIYVIVKIGRSGQQIHWRHFLNTATLGGILLLAAMVFLASYAVKHWRREGAMTPIEAQVMEMNMPAPPGVTAVTLSKVKRGNIAEIVSYSGQAVSYAEQSVIPRVTGVIESMSVYVGDRVKRGQVLARLDTSQLDPQVTERAAGANAASQGIGVAAAEYEAALQRVVEMQAALSVKESSVAEARAMLEAAKQEKLVAEAQVDAAQSEIASTQAEVASAEENATFRADELSRMRQLYAQKAVSRSELQEAESESADASAKLRQARAAVWNAESRLAAAKAGMNKASAMISAAQRRINQSEAEVRAAKAAITSSQKQADAANKKISREQAAAAQARASLQGATTQRGYSVLKAELDGVVTERLVTPGTLVSPGQPVLRISQVSPIRLQASVAASDLESIRIGSIAHVSANKAEEIKTRITSVQPALDPRARTGTAEALWPNSDRRFLPGQFINMRIELSSKKNVLIVPVRAIQRPAGDASPFVWLAEPTEGERYVVKTLPISVGVSDGESAEIIGEIKEGDMVVSAGFTYLREGGEVTAVGGSSAKSTNRIEITASGYQPDTIIVETGKKVSLTFIRRTDQTCGTEVAFPDLNIKKDLPLNKEVQVSFVPKEVKTYSFTCGMDMLRGKVVVR